MRANAIFLLIALLLPAGGFADFRTDWAYHSSTPGSRETERVPGESFTFLGNGTETVTDSDPVTLYLLTDQDFAEEMKEQVFVRWWNGSRAHWIQGRWIKNITLDASDPETCFHGLPREGTRSLDLWKVRIPASLTQPGDNYYAIQLKGTRDGISEERYLLRKLAGDFSQTNPLGQIWSASEEFDGQDWKIEVLP